MREQGCKKILAMRDNVVSLPRLTEPRAPLSITAYPTGQAGRERLEQFIRGVFYHAYGARIHTFYPMLLGITAPDDAFAAVAGVRPAGSEPLFAEHYLDDSVEACLSRQFGMNVTREAIVEVGNLAPASAGQARWLIAALTAYLHAAGFSWVVFTAVPALYNAFTRMGLPLTALAPADETKLDHGSNDDWGRYYQARPVVYAGEIRRGYNDISSLIEPGMHHLWALWCESLFEGARLTQAGARRRLAGGL